LNHPEYRLGRGGTLNWSFPEVRKYKLGLMTELLENYDLAGLELDFLRHWSYFSGDVSSQRRASIMEDFIYQVRRLLDRTASSKSRRWLCVRVPAFLVKHEALGIDLRRFVKAGVDMLNLSASFLTQQEDDLPAVRRMLPDATIYKELNHCTMTATLPSPDREKLDQFHYRRTTDDEFYTTANLAYREGADGFSLFNFVYYREHGDPRGTFHEPPFHVLPRLRNRRWLTERRQQYYFLGSTTNDRSIVDFQLDRRLNVGEPTSLTMRLRPSRDRADLNLYVRIHTRQPSSAMQWQVRLNDHPLYRLDFQGEPIPQQYDGLLGNGNQRNDWSGSARLLREGDNQLIVSLESGDPVDVVRADVVLTPRRWCPQDRQWHDM
jgi:hypothetical protein